MTAGLTKIAGTAIVTPAKPRRLPKKKAAVGAAGGRHIEAADVVRLGKIVEQRCPVAAMCVAAGVTMEVEWRLVEAVAEEAE